MLNSKRWTDAELAMPTSGQTHEQDMAIAIQCLNLPTTAVLLVHSATSHQGDKGIEDLPFPLKGSEELSLFPFKRSALNSSMLQGWHFT
jgi:hypothetical protein